MNNSNNFNVCEKCGTANPLIAKYCYQCGAHLKTPEDPIVCNNCNTVNSGSARYCKHCGNKLFRGSTVKICPRCNHTVNGDAYICERCGFEFVAMRPVVQNIPQLPQNAGGSAENRKPNKKELRKQQAAQQQTYYAPPAQPVYAQPQQTVYLPAAAASTVGSEKKYEARVRTWGAIIMLLSLAFLYAFVGYPAIMPQNLLGGEMLGYYSVEGGNFSTAGQLLWSFADNFNSLKSFSVGEWTLGILAALFAISGVAMFLFGLIKLCTGKGSKKASKWCLFVFVLGVVVVGLIALIGKIDMGLFNTVEKGLFGENSDFDGGWTLWFAPAFFFLIYLFSFGARRKRQ